jgi:hypothetical protein
MAVCYINNYLADQETKDTQTGEHKNITNNPATRGAGIVISIARRVLTFILPLIFNAIILSP